MGILGKLQRGVLTWVLVLGFVPAAQPFRASEPRQQIVRSYGLDVSFFPEESRMEGQATISFRTPAGPPSGLVFYLHGELRVESVESAGGGLDFRQEKVLYEFDYSMVATKVTVEPAHGILDGDLLVRYEGSLVPGLSTTVLSFSSTT